MTIPIVVINGIAPTSCYGIIDNYYNPDGQGRLENGKLRNAVRTLEFIFNEKHSREPSLQNYDYSNLMGLYNAGISAAENDADRFEVPDHVLICIHRK
jgi:hypothetical protein